MRAFEVLGAAGEVAEEIQEMSRRFAEGLAAYRRFDWTAAEVAFSSALELMPEDAACRVFLARLQHIEADPPAANWDGIWPPRPA